LSEYGQTDEFFRGSILESTHWMVLRRPSEPAAVTGQVKSARNHLSDNPSNWNVAE
jgi:hypothetical protein